MPTLGGVQVFQVASTCTHIAATVNECEGSAIFIHYEACSFAELSTLIAYGHQHSKTHVRKSLCQEWSNFHPHPFLAQRLLVALLFSRRPFCIVETRMKDCRYKGSSLAAKLVGGKQQCYITEATRKNVCCPWSFSLSPPPHVGSVKRGWRVDEGKALTGWTSVHVTFYGQTLAVRAYIYRIAEI